MMNISPHFVGKYETVLSPSGEYTSPGALRASHARSVAHPPPEASGHGVAPALSPPIVQSPGKQQPRKHWSALLRLSVLALLLLGLVGSGLGALFTLHLWSFGAPSPLLGHAFFVNSGQVDLTQVNSPGLNDELEIDLQNIPPPVAGKAYYVWLVQDNEGGTLLLGKLTVNAGQVHILFPGIEQHTDLLAITNSLLITEEDGSGTPSHPSFDTERYHAELSQEPDPADPHHFSVLDHLRHLLSGEQTLNALGIHGGLDVWLLRNTASVAGWASIARDYWSGTNTNAAFLRGQLVHILDVLEGTQVDPRDTLVARIALIDTPQREPPDHLDHVINHLDALARAPGATQEQRALASQIETSLMQVKPELEQVQTDAKQLVAMTDQQLTQSQAHSLLDDMATAANHAYLGQIDSSTGYVQQRGVVQIAGAIEHLATFDVMASSTP